MCPNKKNYYKYSYRFAALTRNIRYRRGGKVDIKMPLFRDIKTPEFLRLDAQNNSNSNSNPVPYSFKASELNGKTAIPTEL